LGFYAAVACVFFEFVIGSLMDAVGRKWVSTVGYFVSGVALFLMPLFNMQVFPYLYILRIFQALGILPMINSPLFLDYIKQSTIATSGAWISLIGTVANIVSLCGTLVLSTKVDVGYIFIGFGVLVILVGIVMIFGIKEVERK